MKHRETGRLVVVLGDQLDRRSAAFDDFDAQTDTVWMAEAEEEATHVWSHKARIVLFLSAMRHFRNALEKRGIQVEYHPLDPAEGARTLKGCLIDSVQKLKPKSLVLVEPGEWRIQQAFVRAAKALGIPLEIHPDRHFLCSRDEFEEFAEGRKTLVMEPFYHWMRRKTGILTEKNAPVGGEWNYDKDNRKPFGKEGPGEVPIPHRFSPDRVTREVISLVNRKFAQHPGSLKEFDWPVTPRQAKKALEDFITHRLPQFGPYEDAMWMGAPFLYHSRLSSALNLKLLDPRTALQGAEEALRQKEAPINSVEGFVRQVLGWREYVRGIYWKYMPDYADENHLGAHLPLPDFYWTAETEMNCLRECLKQTLDYGYAHHIQRLMVTGLFALLLGVDPKEVHQWYLAIYVDAVEWVELPNTIGMSQFADGGIMATKPYTASGSYINRMSNYCTGCGYRPSDRTGSKACPFTTLYWDFLIRHEKKLSPNPRMRLQLRNLEKLEKRERQSIRQAAHRIRERIEAGI